MVIDETSLLICSARLGKTLAAILMKLKVASMTQLSLQLYERGFTILLKYLQILHSIPHKPFTKTPLKLLMRTSRLLQSIPGPIAHPTHSSAPSPSSFPPLHPSIFAQITLSQKIVSAVLAIVKAMMITIFAGRLVLRHKSIRCEFEAPSSG